MRRKSTLFKIAAILSIVLFVPGCKTQDVTEYRWEKPALILITDEQSNPAYKGQIALLESEVDRLKQREILVFLVGPKYYRIGLENEMRKASVEFYNHFNDPAEPFEILLVGLDGEVKMRENRILTAQELYAAIDEATLSEQ